MLRMRSPAPVLPCGAAAARQFLKVTTIVRVTAAAAEPARAATAIQVQGVVAAAMRWRRKRRLIQISMKAQKTSHRTRRLRAAQVAAAMEPTAVVDRRVAVQMMSIQTRRQMINEVVTGIRDLEDRKQRYMIHIVE